jgi:hypothetical protein
LFKDHKKVKIAKEPLSYRTIEVSPCMTIDGYIPTKHDKKLVAKILSKKPQNFDARLNCTEQSKKKDYFKAAKSLALSYEPSLRGTKRS